MVHVSVSERTISALRKKKKNTLNATHCPGYTTLGFTNKHSFINIQLTVDRTPRGGYCGGWVRFTVSFTR